VRLVFIVVSVLVLIDLVLIVNVIMEELSHITIYLIWSQLWSV